MLHPGDAECSHGTGSFVDVVVGQSAPEQEKLNVYYAWTLPNRQQPGHFIHTFCLEADTTVSGAALRWMKEHARLIDDYAEVGPLAASVRDSGGVVFVPAFTGLNVPHNDPTARGSIFGLTLGSSRAQLVRAFLESLGYQIRGILETITAETGLSVERISTGGGLTASDEACQIQADLTGIPTVRPPSPNWPPAPPPCWPGWGWRCGPRPMICPPCPAHPPSLSRACPPWNGRPVTRAGWRRWSGPKIGLIPKRVRALAQWRGTGLKCGP